MGKHLILVKFDCNTQDQVSPGYKKKQQLSSEVSINNPHASNQVQGKTERLTDVDILCEGHAATMINPIYNQSMTQYQYFVPTKPFLVDFVQRKHCVAQYIGILLLLVTHYTLPILVVGNILKINMHIFLLTAYFSYYCSILIQVIVDLM